MGHDPRFKKLQVVLGQEENLIFCDLSPFCANMDLIQLFQVCLAYTILAGKLKLYHGYWLVFVDLELTMSLVIFLPLNQTFLQEPVIF